MDKNAFQNLIERYQQGDISAGELKKLVNYYYSFQEGNDWIEELGPEERLKNKMLISILETIEEAKPVKKLPFYKHSYFKYAIAASVALLLYLGIFQQGPANVSLTADETSEIVEIGGPKATLTLSDGSTVQLSESKKFKQGTVESDGKELVYGASEKPLENISYNYLTVPRGGQFVVKLSDDTRVWLNSDSKIKYPEKFQQGKVREVELLYGEAYFDVSPSTQHQGARFKVKTQGQVVEVLGTEFNVHAYAEEPLIKTTLVEGVIRLSTGSAKSRELLPGEQAVLNKANNNLLIAKVETYYETAWKNGLFSFNGKSLKEIMTVISRWYDVEVDFQNSDLQNITFNGQLSKNQNLETILKLIQNTNLIHAYEIKNNTVILK